MCVRIGNRVFSLFRAIYVAQYHPLGNTKKSQVPLTYSIAGLSYVNIPSFFEM